MLGRVVVGVVVLAGVAVGVDRGGAYLAGEQVAERVQTSEHLAHKPDVTIHGFPFLTQVVGGRYHDVEVVARGVHVRHVVLTTVTAHLRDARVPLSAVLGRSLGAVPVRQVDAAVLVSYPDLQRAVADRHLRLSPAHPGVLVTGTVSVAGRQVTATAVATVAFNDRAFVVRAHDVRVDGRAPPSGTASALAEALSFRVDVPDLPYGLRLTAAATTDAGLVLSARATDVVLQP